VTTRDAFHRQGPFVGSGGLYSPGPATTPPPFGETRSPLNDVLTPSWVLPGTSPRYLGEARVTRHRFDRRGAEKETLSCHRPDAAPT